MVAAKIPWLVQSRALFLAKLHLLQAIPEVQLQRVAAALAYDAKFLKKE